MNNTKKKTNSYLEYLNPILDFLAIQDIPKKSDVIFVFGSTKNYVAEHAANLYLKNLAPYILISGHKSERCENLHKKSEAEFMKEEVIKLAVPVDKIITEDKAANTLENVLFGIKELKDRGVKINSAILTAKPFHLRRCRATFKKQFPKIKLYCSSPKMTSAEYLSYETDRSENQVIERIIGEIERLKIYAEKGDIIYEDIPANIKNAADKLKIDLL